MKTAKELLSIAIKSNDNIVNKTLDGAYEHILKRIEQEAKEGATYYNFYCDQVKIFNRDKLLKEVIKMVEPLEENGYKIYIYDDGNGYYCNLVISVSWFDKKPKMLFGNEVCLYVSKLK